MQRSHEPVAAHVVQQRSPAEVLAKMRARLRLQPDRRFMQAFARLDALTGASPSAQPRATFDNGQWRVRVGSNELGVLAELPSFEERPSAVTAATA